VLDRVKIRKVQLPILLLFPATAVLLETLCKSVTKRGHDGHAGVRPDSMYLDLMMFGKRRGEVFVDQMLIA